MFTSPLICILHLFSDVHTASFFDELRKNAQQKLIQNSYKLLKTHKMKKVLLACSVLLATA